MSSIYLALLLLCGISSCFALECYVCRDQEDNEDKCVKTVEQCDAYQDFCITHIQWEVPKYWTPRGDRIHYVTKGCDSRASCYQQKETVKSRCKRDWYNDWHCVECCQGDLCNYYVTMGSGTIKASIVTLLAGIFTVAVYRFL